MADRQTSAYGTSVSPILMFGTGFLALTLNVGADADVIYKNVQYVYPDDSGMSSHLYGNGLSLPDDGYLIEPKGVLSVPDKLLDVKSFFSLNVSDMSNVFDVSRPMIYSWLNGDSSPRASNLEKISSLWSIANSYYSKFSQPLGELSTYTDISGHDLKYYLCQDKEGLERYLTSLLRSVDSRDETPTDIAKRLGLQVVG